MSFVRLRNESVERQVHHRFRSFWWVLDVVEEEPPPFIHIGRLVRLVGIGMEYESWELVRPALLEVLHELRGRGA